MEAIHFLVKGSASGPYRVSFRKDGRNPSAYCTCAAGENGMYCKHRIRILQGLVEAVVSGNCDEVARVAGWLSGTDVEMALQDVISLQEQSERIKHALTAAKKALARCLLD